jgi:sugar/nucleoside kinase (ribokinase family)
VAITAGARPTLVLAHDARELTLDVPPLAQAVDDVGAGDVFAAAFFIALSEGRSPEQAGHFANAAAAVRMCGAGADAIGRRAEIEARLTPAALGR